MKHSIRRLCFSAFLTALLVAQEEALTVLPNIQLTVFLILLYAVCLPLYETSTIVVAYVLLDCLFMGALNPISFVFQIFGWLLIPLLMKTIFKRVQDPLWLALLGILFSLLYSWVMIIPGLLILQIPFWTYMAQDVLYELLLAASSFLSILLLYKPTKKLMDRFLKAL